MFLYGGSMGDVIHVFKVPVKLTLIDQSGNKHCKKLLDLLLSFFSLRILSILLTLSIRIAFGKHESSWFPPLLLAALFRKIVLNIQSAKRMLINIRKNIIGIN